MDEVECRLEVYVDYSIPLSLRHTHHEAVLCDTCVVYKHVDTTEVLNNLLYNLVCLVEVSGVRCVGLSLHAQSLELLYGLLYSLVYYKVCECYVSTLLSKTYCDSLADTAASTCYECYLTFQKFHSVILFLWFIIVLLLTIPLAEGYAGVVTAEAERVRDSNSERCLHSLERCVVEVALWIGVCKTNCRCYDAVVE